MEEKYYTESDRNWVAEIPLWVPGFRGQLAYGDYDFSSSEGSEEQDRERASGDFGIEFYFVGRLAVKHGNLWFAADAFSGKVSSLFSYTSLIGSNEKEFVDITVRGTFPRLTAGYSVWQQSTENHFRLELIPYLGVRHINILLQSDVFDLDNVIDVRPDWFEPLIGLYIPVAYKRFLLEIQSDFGSAKSKNSWVFSTRLRYRISKLVDVQLGWNHLRIYQKGNFAGQQLESTLRLFGPTAGVGFRF